MSAALLSTPKVSLRWDPYFLKHGSDFESFWREYLQVGRNVLYVLGRGFDPRMCNGLDVVFGVGGSGARDCLLIEFDEGPNTATNQNALVEYNLERLTKIIQGQGVVKRKPVPIWSDNSLMKHRVGSRHAAGIFTLLSDISDYTDIIVDISAIPRSLYFPLIGKLLFLIDGERTQNRLSRVPNLHVVTSEDPSLDRSINDVGLDEGAEYIHGFEDGLEMEATAHVPRVWIPILGEDQRPQLERIYQKVNPDEICPLLPSPANDPRRADNLVVEYRDLLFDSWRIEPRNIIYASERNPFEVYKRIIEVVQHYTHTLEPLDGCKAVISALSSKLLSVGALLAAYELKEADFGIGVAHVDVRGYDLVSAPADEHAPVKELFTILLAGDSDDE
jgi:hypothetical protein